jgi:hypothetical protein
MFSARIGHTATLMSSGNVLFAGGSNGVAAATLVETYQPDQRVFLRGSEMRPQLWHQAAAADNHVVLLGGVDFVGGLVATAQAYEQGVVRPAGVPALSTPRRAFTLVTLADGRLLVAGGFGEDGKVLSSTEILAPGGALWEPGEPLGVARAHHTATVLDDGTVLLIGGLGAEGQVIDSIERFDPARGSIGEDRLKLARWGHTASLLDDGRVLVVGGFAGSAPGSPTPWVEAITVGENQLDVRQLSSLREARAGHTATVVGGGWLVVAGGFNGAHVLDSMEVFVHP